MIQNRIKEYRARHNMTQGELADLVGVRRETIGNLEKGRYNPSLVLAWRIAAVFQVTIEEIFTVEREDCQGSSAVQIKRVYRGDRRYTRFFALCRERD